MSGTEGGARRSEPGFFSSVASLRLPPGERATADAVGGYYLDLRVKAPPGTRWPPEGMQPPGRRLHVAAIQCALGCWERYLAGEGEAWLELARACADELVAIQVTDGPRAGGWTHELDYPHTFALRAPWLSAMAQGEGASLLVRLHAHTGDERYAEAARRALLPFAVDAADGGVRAWLHGQPFPEEYPTIPPAFVLNGGIFAMWGLHDVGVALGDADALASFRAMAGTLADHLERWDTGWGWSRYDLQRRPVVNVATTFYHDLHVSQLRMLHRLEPRPELLAVADRWERTARRAAARWRAFAAKALFRAVVPRQPALARLLPWSPPHGRA